MFSGSLYVSVKNKWNLNQCKTPEWYTLASCYHNQAWIAYIKPNYNFVFVRTSKTMKELPA